MWAFFKGWRRKIGLILFGLLFVFLCAPLVEKHFFDCAVCGMNRSEIHLLGLEWSSIDEDTECSKWYGKNVESHHNHVWVRGTWAESSSVCGIGYGGSNLAGRAGGPLVRFGSATRLLMYEHGPDPKLVRNAFLRLSKREKELTLQRDQQIKIERKLADWENSNFAGPWPIEPE